MTRDRPELAMDGFSPESTGGRLRCSSLASFVVAFSSSSSILGFFSR